MGVDVETRDHTPDADHAAVERAIDMLRSEGHRITGARHAVIETLATIDGHPSAEQLSEQVRSLHPTVHRATVYRTLETLAAIGVVTQVHLAGSATTYHLAGDATGRDHLHASCRVCGRIIDLPGDLLDPVMRRLAEERDFALDPPHIALSGTCHTCR
ncbi:Fur family transcriptional regulator [Jiangella asiatica]|uniref:Transcriptional repressor n=1 Tax=Jiangella asiatica TaxID=2530372 RepID=A0A4R5DM11_9ACTN|nr:Fur family transcriptional regulator [Jiangella asiatica]TDE13021.1 transcriptional repressor [Jiangella asiatica]